jgi:hypothetical protein
MSQFVYLYRRPNLPSGSPQQMQETMQRWQAWFKKMEAEGHLANLGQPLDPKGGGVVKDKKGSFNDGPYAETKDIVMGYSLVEANDLAHAIALTNGHPIFDQDGVIEVRPVMKM